MKIILYTRRNVGLYCLSHLVALGHEVKVVTDDDNVKWLAGRYRCKLVDLETMGEFDLAISIHWNKIIPDKYLKSGIWANIHPALYLFRGKNPIKKYMEEKRRLGSVESHYMTSVVDGGEVIHQEFFHTPVITDYTQYYDIAIKFYFKTLDETLNKILK